MKRRSDNKPLVAITVGDYNGIGPEIILKSIAQPSIRRVCTPILIGPVVAFEFYAQKLRLPFHLQQATYSTQPVTIYDAATSSSSVALIESSKLPRSDISPGKVTKGAGQASLRAVTLAVTLARLGIVNAIVTAPISKEALHKAGSKFPGHTELLQHLTSAKSVAMMLVSTEMRIGLATIHIPLKQVSKALSHVLLRQRIQTIHDALVTDWQIRKPKLAILGMNPHAGENGEIGLEEQRIIRPAIHELLGKGMDIHGPFPADAFFGTYKRGSFDAIVAMYHDQGLIPLKMSSFEKGVNVTVGLPIVRTSPDHGTAFDIAGRGIANPSSMIMAIKLAAEIVANRKLQAGRRA
jgi:4-hydroxythreonine-4-phosphate dehydrogenase